MWCGGVWCGVMWWGGVGCGVSNEMDDLIML